MHQTTVCFNNDDFLLVLKAFGRVASAYYQLATRSSIPDDFNSTVRAMCLFIDALRLDSTLSYVIDENKEIVAGFGKLSRLLQCDKPPLSKIADQIIICNQLVSQRQPRYM